MVSPARWRELEALEPTALRSAYSASLRDRQALSEALREPVTMPDAFIRLRDTTFAKLQAQGRPKQDLVGYVAASEDVAARKRKRLEEARRA